MQTEIAQSNTADHALGKHTVPWVYSLIIQDKFYHAGTQTLYSILDPPTVPLPCAHTSLSSLMLYDSNLEGKT